MTEYSERELILPPLAFLDQTPTGLTTSDLIALLTEALRPDGRDAQILGGRRDTYFSQKVRNLVSHRTLAGRGMTTYDAARQLQAITPADRPELGPPVRRPWDLARVASDVRQPGRRRGPVGRGRQ